jgi:hypothetical protein
VWPTLLVFALSYLVISGQRIPGLRLDRPSAALCGAVMMVLLGTLNHKEAFASIDLDTLALLGLPPIAPPSTRAPRGPCWWWSSWWRVWRPPSW